MSHDVDADWLKTLVFAPLVLLGVASCGGSSGGTESVDSVVPPLVVPVTTAAPSTAMPSTTAAPTTTLSNAEAGIADLATTYDLCQGIFPTSAQTATFSVDPQSGDGYEATITWSGGALSGLDILVYAV